MDESNPDQFFLFTAPKKIRKPLNLCENTKPWIKSSEFKCVD